MFHSGGKAMVRLDGAGHMSEQHRECRVLRRELKTVYKVDVIISCP